METESVLYQELNRQEIAELKKIAALWNIPKFGGKDKKQSVQQLYHALQDEFLLKGVLEKLTPIQVSILTQILKNKNVQTLGEIIRKVNLPPLNVEMELGVLRKYSLVYQRKNRERLTNNLDKYHAFEEIAGHVKLDTNQKGEKFRLSLEKNYIKPVLKNISHNYIKALGLKKAESENEFYKLAFSDEGISRVLGSLGEFEKDTILHIYTHGGVIESEVLKHYIVVNRGKFEDTVPLLTELGLIFDTYFLEDKFIRIAVLPREVIAYIQKNPVQPSVKKGTKQKQEKTAHNDLDFFLNIKKMISFISRKGLGLAKSGKIKQADNKRTEQELLKPDIDIFPEKGQVYQIELILPILKLLGLVDIKTENVILTGDTDLFLRKDIFEVMNTVIHEVNEVRSRRFNPPEVFTATEVPFYDKPILDKTVKLIIEVGKVSLPMMFSMIARENLIMSPGFKIKNFETDLHDLKKEIVSAIFYLHLFGLLEVEYPGRFLTLSELGKNYFQNKPLNKTTEKGGITINPDFSIIAFPEKCSITGIHLLKVFTELKDYDRVFTFQLNKDSFQEGILLGYDHQLFIQFLRESSKGELAQNLMFLFDDWSRNLPIIVVKEDCVLVKTEETHVMEMLVGQIKGKKIIIEEISPNAILIDKAKIQDVILASEKLNMIIKLIQ